MIENSYVFKKICKHKKIPAHHGTRAVKHLSQFSSLPFAWKHACYLCTLFLRKNEMH